MSSFEEVKVKKKLMKRGEDQGGRESEVYDGCEVEGAGVEAEAERGEEQVLVLSSLSSQE